jgi:protein-disulfide isomerase
MSKKTKLIIGSGIVAVIAIFILVAYARLAWQDSLQRTAEQYQVNPDITSPGPYGEQAGDALVTKGVLVPPIRQGDPIQGSRFAQLFIIEFGDFQCAYCADMAGILKQVVTNLPAVAVVWKDLAIPVHFEARPAALAARCAQAQDKFWEYHDLLFANQDQLGEELYLELARLLELDMSSFQSCLESQAFVAAVGQGLEDANNYSVDGTPYLFVGSQRVNQLVTYEELTALIEAELTRQAELDN